MITIDLCYILSFFNLTFIHNADHRRSRGGALGGNSPSRESKIGRTPKTESNRETGTSDICRRIFWALSASIMHLRSGVRSLPRTPLGELTALPQTPNWFLRSHPCSWLLASNYGPRPGVPPARPIPGYAHGADDKTQLELKRKCIK